MGEHHEVIENVGYDDTFKSLVKWQAAAVGNAHSHHRANVAKDNALCLAKSELPLNALNCEVPVQAIAEVP